MTTHSTSASLLTHVTGKETHTHNKTDQSNLTKVEVYVQDNGLRRLGVRYLVLGRVASR